MTQTDIFAVLANPVRRRILEVLLEKPSTVNRLVEQFELQRPAVSEHLQVLRNARLVRDEKRGRERFYHIEPQLLNEAALWLSPFVHYWKQRLKSLEETLDEEQL